MQKILVQFAVLVAAVVGLSFVSHRLWAGTPEGRFETKPLVIEEGMTVAGYARRNELPPRLVKQVFGLQSQQEGRKPLTAFGMSEDRIRRKTLGFLKRKLLP